MKAKKNIPAKEGSVGYKRPPLHTRFKPGQSGNPNGRPSAGATIREWINQLAQQDLTQDQLRKIARGKKTGWTKRAAAERILRTLEAPDLVDFMPYLEGGVDLKALRDKGVNTEAVKKAKVKIREFGGVKNVEREIELYDRSGADFDRVIDHTESRPKQEVDVTSKGERIEFVDRAAWDRV